MDPDDRHDPLLPEMDCAVCGGTVGSARLRVLAQREDLTFLQVACPACGSTTLGIIVAGVGVADPPPEDASDVAAATLGEPDRAPIPSAPALTREDVEAVRDLLAGYHGSVAGLLARSVEDEGAP
jgi:hypothetical protein